VLSASEIGELFARLERLLDRVEAILPTPAPPPDWNASAFRWRSAGARSPAGGPSSALDTARGPRRSRRAEARDRREHAQFVAALPANNVLLTGSRGTGKSSLIKAMLVKYAAKGLRLIEVDKSDLVELPDIAEIVAARPERFIVYCDDLTFDAGEPGYKALKVMLDGTIAAPSANMLIYATSNRRHLIPEYFSENLETTHVGGEVHPGESVEEKISLSERFGVWITFYPFSQDDYLAATASWLASFGVAAPKSARETEARHREALQFALQRGSRSGRVAWQFAKGYAGAQGLRGKRRA
jgi:predicted AAA+ superfamily ATPase